jgi:hypothetical protein
MTLLLRWRTRKLSNISHPILNTLWPSPSLDEAREPMILKDRLGGKPLSGINLQHLAQQRLDGIRLLLRHRDLRPVEQRLDRRLLELELLLAVRVGVEQLPLLVKVAAGALPRLVQVVRERAERGGDAEEVVVVTLRGSRVGAGEEERVAGEELEE